MIKRCVAWLVSWYDAAVCCWAEAELSETLERIDRGET